MLTDMCRKVGIERVKRNMAGRREKLERVVWRDERGVVGYQGWTKGSGLFVRSGYQSKTKTPYRDDGERSIRFRTISVPSHKKSR